jgi:uncharacterized protein
MILMWSVVGVGTLYGIITLYLSHLVQAFPRRPVKDVPDWGKMEDLRIPTVDGGELEVWRVTPDGGGTRGVVLLAHGWGRNRDRMTERARVFGQLGFTTVMHSARDHGESSPKCHMTAMCFAEDIEAVMAWIGEPVILYGHSAGSGGAAIVASRNPGKIKLLFLEASYPSTREAMLSLYRWVHPIFGYGFGPAIVFWVNLFNQFRLPQVDPSRLATKIDVPVMVLHGEKDRRFPMSFAHRLMAAFKPGQATLYIGPGAGHSDTSKTPGYASAVTEFINRHLPA